MDYVIEDNVEVWESRKCDVEVRQAGVGKWQWQWHFAAPCKVPPTLG